MTTKSGLDGNLTYLDFLKYDQLFCEGDTPESIEEGLREHVEQRAEDLFGAVGFNLSQINSIANQWLKEAENLPHLGSSQETEIKVLERSVEELRQSKDELDKTFRLAKKKLEEQKVLRTDLLKKLENHQILLENTPDRDPREEVLIDGGRIACENLNTGKYQ